MASKTWRVPTVTADGDTVKPNVVVTLSKEAGVRVLLGSTDPHSQAPDLFIERRKCGWAITVHGIGQEDPSGYVYILDDGRTSAAPEMAWGNTPAMEMLDAHQSPQELDDNGKENCDKCGSEYESGGDGYAGLCPSCADKKYPSDV